MIYLLAAADPLEHVLPHRIGSFILGGHEIVVTNQMLMAAVAAVLMILIFPVLFRKVDTEAPRGARNFLEAILSFLREDVIRPSLKENTDRFVPFLWSLFFFILICNLLGLVPAFESPTAVPSVPLGCAIVAFCYYNYQGVKAQGGLNYAKHFAGPMPALAPLMIPIELISHLARMLSLTIRLFANMFAGDMVTLVFFSLVPIGVPIIFLGLHIGVSFLQAYIFVLLTTVYLSGAVAHEH